MNRYIETIENCKLCGHNKLESYLNFGFTPLANSLKKNEGDEEFLAPLEVVKCLNPKCECFQLKHLVDPEILFSNYLYRSSNGLENHFFEFAKRAVNVLKLKKGDLMVGIGGNIGLLEMGFKKLGLKTINVEPATNIAEESLRNGIQTYNNFFDINVANAIKESNNRKAKVICCCNCFAHTDVSPLISGVKALLHEDGVFIIENAYWLDSIRNKDFGQIYSEHKYMYSIKPLKNFFNLHEMDLFKVEFNDMQCGSFRAYIKWTKNSKIKIHPSVEKAIKNEEESGLYHKETYSKFISDLENTRNDLIKVLDSAKKSGKKIGIFSVAAKTVLMLQYFGIKDYFQFASDDSNLKYNKFIPGTSIKIIEKQEFFAKEFDYILVGAYNFFEQIHNKNKNGVTKWIKVIPELEIFV